MLCKDASSLVTASLIKASCLVMLKEIEVCTDHSVLIYVPVSRILYSAFNIRT